MAHPTIYNKVDVLNKFRQPSTLKDASVSTYIAKRMLDEGLIEQAGKVESGKRGRPAILFKLTTKGLSASGPVADPNEDEAPVEIPQPQIELAVEADQEPLVA